MTKLTQKLEAKKKQRKVLDAEIKYLQAQVELAEHKHITNERTE